MAKAAGVSHGTASNVFSRPEIVREEVRERVKAAAEKLGYGGPDPKGRLLRAGKVNAIGVATAEPLAYFFDDPFARVVMSGIGEACDRTGAGISLVSAANDEQLAWNIRSALVDGFIVFCLENGSQLIDLTRERGLPFVALDFGFDDETISALGVDDVEGGRRAARHLTELGHRRFAVLSLALADTTVGASLVERGGDSDAIPGRATACAATPRCSLPPAFRSTAFPSTRPTTTGRRPRQAWSIFSLRTHRRPPSSQCPTRSRSMRSTG